MSKKTDAIGPRIRQAPHRVHQRAHRLDGLMAQRIGARRCFWPHNRGDKTSSGTAAFAKPAGSHAQQSTTGEVLRETDIFLREAVAAVQKQDTRKRPRATWSCHGRDQTAYVWNGYVNPLGFKPFGSRRRVGNRNYWLRSHQSWSHRSPGHHVEGGSLAEIFVARSATRWLRL